MLDLYKLENLLMFKNESYLYYSLVIYKEVLFKFRIVPDIIASNGSGVQILVTIDLY